MTEQTMGTSATQTGLLQKAGEGSSREALATIEALRKRFGPGVSNGVAAILLHDDLPETFDKSSWADWTFKPAEAAFEVAFDMGLIVRSKLSARWCMTPLGHEVGAIFRAESDAQ